MKLKECNSVKEVGKWMQEKGFTPGENALFGGVHPVHTSSSLHYSVVKSGKVVKQANLQGRLALDVNDNDVRDDRLPFDNEGEALRWLFSKLLEVARIYHWPLDEMFHAGRGFIKERGYGHNHPISNHENHLHVGFFKESW